MTTATSSHIVLDDQGRAWISGTTCKVREIVVKKLAHDWEADDIRRELPQLSLAQIHAALAYYYDHQAELDAEIARELTEVEAMALAAGASPFASRMRLLGKLPNRQ